MKAAITISLDIEVAQSLDRATSNRSQFIEDLLKREFETPVKKDELQELEDELVSIENKQQAKSKHNSDKFNSPLGIALLTDVRKYKEAVAQGRDKNVTELKLSEKIDWAAKRLGVRSVDLIEELEKDRLAKLGTN